MKTINHEEKIYQVGGVYEFSDDGKDWCVGVLEGTQPKSNYPYRTYSGHGFSLIRACEVKVGTVEEAPVELIDSECYRYKDLYGNERKGYFSAKHGVFCGNGGFDYASECTNIKLLTVVGE